VFGRPVTDRHGGIITSDGVPASGKTIILMDDNAIGDAAFAVVSNGVVLNTCFSL
jgi:hypothetical protein